MKLHEGATISLLRLGKGKLRKVSILEDLFHAHNPPGGDVVQTVSDPLNHRRIGKYVDRLAQAFEIPVGEQNRLWRTILGDDHRGVLLFNAAENVEQLRLRRRYGDMLVNGHGKNCAWDFDYYQRTRSRTFLAVGALLLKGFLCSSDAQPYHHTLPLTHLLSSRYSEQPA